MCDDPERSGVCNVKPEFPLGDSCPEDVGSGKDPSHNYLWRCGSAFLCANPNGVPERKAGCESFVFSTCAVGLCACVSGDDLFGRNACAKVVRNFIDDVGVNKLRSSNWNCGLPDIGFLYAEREHAGFVVNLDPFCCVGDSRPWFWAVGENARCDHCAGVVRV